jgi:hypothetical protein
LRRGSKSSGRRLHGRLHFRSALFDRMSSRWSLHLSSSRWPAPTAFRDAVVAPTSAPVCAPGRGGGVGASCVTAPSATKDSHRCDRLDPGPRATVRPLLLPALAHCGAIASAASAVSRFPRFPAPALCSPGHLSYPLPSGLSMAGSVRLLPVMEIRLRPCCFVATAVELPCLSRPSALYLFRCHHPLS